MNSLNSGTIKVIKKTLRNTKSKKDIKLITDYVNILKTRNVISDTEYNYILTK